MLVAGTAAHVFELWLSRYEVDVDTTVAPTLVVLAVPSVVRSRRPVPVHAMVLHDVQPAHGVEVHAAILLRRSALVGGSLFSLAKEYTGREPRLLPE